MGYRIIYDGKRKRVLGVCLAFALGMLLGACLVPDGRRAIQTALIPGDPEVTLRAGELLRSALHRGEGLVSSALEFCREAASGLG